MGPGEGGGGGIDLAAVRRSLELRSTGSFPVTSCHVLADQSRAVTPQARAAVVGCAGFSLLWTHRLSTAGRGRRGASATGTPRWIIRTAAGPFVRTALIADTGIDPVIATRTPAGSGGTIGWRRSRTRGGSGRTIIPLYTSPPTASGRSTNSITSICTRAARALITTANGVPTSGFSRRSADRSGLHTSAGNTCPCEDAVLHRKE